MSQNNYVANLVSKKLHCYNFQSYLIDENFTCKARLLTLHCIHDFMNPAHPTVRISDVRELNLLVNKIKKLRIPKFFLVRLANFLNLICLNTG